MIVLRKPDEWARGAQDRAPNELVPGLLFAMRRVAIWPVTMEKVMIPLDVYWLGNGGMVLEYAPLFPGQPVYVPTHAARFVVEYPMDVEPRHRVGDFVELPHDATANSGSDSPIPE